MEERLKQIAANNKSLDYEATTHLKQQRKALKEQKANKRNNMPEDIKANSKFLHISSQFQLPIQNWKKGTPFYHEKQQKKEEYNVHSAASARIIPTKLTDKEFDFLMDRRYKIAEVEKPLHNGIFEVVPTRKEPVRKTRGCIWKEYM